MPRTQTAFVCQECGSQYPQSYGRCPGCAAWGSLEETVTGNGSPTRGRGPKSQASALRPLFEVQSTEKARIKVPVEEFNRVLGGGIVPGSVVLLGGDPGIGKSTLLLQIAQQLSQEDHEVLYVTGEESPEQIRIRADRVGTTGGGLSVLDESDVDTIVDAVMSSSPQVLIVDSIQTMQTTDLESAAGSVAQVRESGQRLVRLAKSTGIAIFLVGHVTKEGSLAGPRVLEHMVDVVLQLEGDGFQAYRLLRGLKNRYGATHEIGIFDMRDGGLSQVTNPSSLFLNDGEAPVSGSAVTATIEGTRPLLVEIQALSTRTAFGLPRRSATGIDLSRLHMLTAVLSKRAGIDVTSHDIYVNVVGGLKLAEPAVDLATVLAIYSSHRDRCLSRAVAIGEVGLGGEIRPVQYAERRLLESRKLGIERAVLPKRSPPEVDAVDGIEIIRVNTVGEALEALTSG